MNVKSQNVSNPRRKSPICLVIEAWHIWQAHRLIISGPIFINLIVLTNKKFQTWNLKCDLTNRRKFIQKKCHIIWGWRHLNANIWKETFGWNHLKVNEIFDGNILDGNIWKENLEGNIWMITFERKHLKENIWKKTFGWKHFRWKHLKWTTKVSICRKTLKEGHTCFRLLNCWLQWNLFYIFTFWVLLYITVMELLLKSTKQKPKPWLSMSSVACPIIQISIYILCSPTEGVYFFHPLPAFYTKIFALLNGCIVWLAFLVIPPGETFKAQFELNSWAKATPEQFSTNWWQNTQTMRKVLVQYETEM